MLPSIGHICRTNTLAYEKVTLVMVHKAVISTLGIGWALLASAQPLPSSEDGAPSLADEPVAERSALWTAVRAQQHESDTAPAVRRLSSSERLELREQIRRAAAGQTQAQHIATTPLSQPQMPAGR